MPKVSIIVPIYNVEKYLYKCLLSIEKQTFTDFECILVDDCSPDNSKNICELFCKKDKRFKYIKRKENGGLGAARNTGLDNALGEYVSFIDSDDTIAPNFYITLLPYAEKYGWVRSGRKGVNEKGEVKKIFEIQEGLYTTDDNPLLIQSNDRKYELSTVCSCIYKKSIIGDLRFDTCKYGEDYIFSLELFARYGKVYFKDAHLYNYLQRHDSLSGIKTVNKFQILTFLNSFCKMLRNIKHVKNYKKLKQIYIKNFENRAYVKDLCHNGIDFVFPFVDSTDPVWQKQYLAAKGQAATNQESNGITRFRPNDYLKYLFRGLEKYLPWINKIHLIVASEAQVPSWLDKDKIHVVLHEDIIPAELLPTFNSSTIECFYHNIVGLSDRFIYGNDDMFALSSCSETDFFNGFTPRIEMRKMTNVNGQEIWRRTNINAFRLATGLDEQKIGYYMAPEHGFAAYTKELVHTFNKKHYRKLYNSCSQFREPKNMNIYFYADYLWANNMLEDSPIKFKYIWNKCPISNIKEFFRNARVICLNDTDLEQNPEALKLIKKLFEEKFPNKCVYEIGSNKNKENSSQLFKLPSKELKTIKIEHKSEKPYFERITRKQGDLINSGLPSLDDSIFW